MTKARTASPFKNKNFFVIIAMLLIILFMMQLYTEENNLELSRTEFLAMMSDSNTEITELSLQKVVDGVLIEGRRKMTESEIEKSKSKQNAFSRLTSMRDSSPPTLSFLSHMLEASNEQITEWENHKNVKVKVIHKKTSWLEHLVAFLPIIILIAFFWFIMSRQAGGAKGMFSFGKSQAKQLVQTGKRKTTFRDVAGCDEAKQDLEELVLFLKNPKKFDLLGGRIPKGALLVGPPGTGKTLLARAVAGEAGVPFFSMSGSDFVEMFVGVGASRVRDLFETGKKNAPCILFIDEIDAVGRQRGAGLGGGHDEREQTLNQLLVEMDGFTSNEGVILLAATNRPDVLDKALLRPGRFDRQVVVGLPDIRGREQVLKVHMRKVPISDSVEASVIARGTPGFSGADLANLVNEAALFAARGNKRLVTMEEFEKARDKIMMGAERRSMVMSEKEKENTAYHEAGHAIVGRLVPEHDPIHKVTIIPRRSEE